MWRKIRICFIFLLILHPINAGLFEILYSGIFGDKTNNTDFDGGNLSSILLNETFADYKVMDAVDDAVTNLKVPNEDILHQNLKTFLGKRLQELQTKGKLEKMLNLTVENFKLKNNKNNDSVVGLQNSTTTSKILPTVKSLISNVSVPQKPKQEDEADVPMYEYEVLGEDGGVTKVLPPRSRGVNASGPRKHRKKQTKEMFESTDQVASFLSAAEGNGTQEEPTVETAQESSNENENEKVTENVQPSSEAPQLPENNVSGGNFINELSTAGKISLIACLFEIILILAINIVTVIIYFKTRRQSIALESKKLKKKGGKKKLTKKGSKSSKSSSKKSSSSKKKSTSSKKSSSSSKKKSTSSKKKNTKKNQALKKTKPSKTNSKSDVLGQKVTTSKSKKSSSKSSSTSRQKVGLDIFEQVYDLSLGKWSTNVSKSSESSNAFVSDFVDPSLTYANYLESMMNGKHDDDYYFGSTLTKNGSSLTTKRSSKYLEESDDELTLNEI